MLEGALSIGDPELQNVTWLNGREFVELQSSFWFRPGRGQRGSRTPGRGPDLVGTAN